MKNFIFKTLNSVEVAQLEIPFTKEVKREVYDYDSFKSLDPYSINFSFTKDFSVDFMRFLSEFYSNR